MQPEPNPARVAAQREDDAIRPGESLDGYMFRLANDRSLRGRSTGAAGPGLDRDVPAPAVGTGVPRELRLHSLADLLRDPEALKPPEPVVPRIAYRGRVTLLAAREKDGKSTLATAGTAAMTRGGDFLGERCVKGPGLWVTADQEHAGEIAQRALRFGADPEAFEVLWPHEPFGDLAAAVEKVRPVVVVIDTLANFARVQDPHSAAEWPGVLLPLVHLARDQNLAIVIAHHAVKAEGGGYRDSSAIGATVDLLLEMHRDGDGPRRKLTARGRWPTSGFTVELVGDRYELVAAGELSLDARVLAFVQQHAGCSKLDVRSNIGGRSEDVDVALARLIAQGAVRDAGSDRRHSYEPASTGPLENTSAPPF